VTPATPAPVAVITGATGFAGRHLVRRLGDQVRLIGWHRPGGQPPDESLPLTWRAVDILDAAAVSAAINRYRPSQIYHLAGAPHVGASWQNAVLPLRVNVMGTHRLLDAVRRARRPCRVLVVTSSQVYQPGDEPLDEEARLVPVSPYGASKLAADELARRAAAEDGLDVVIARPFNHAGPGQSSSYVVSSFAWQIARIEAGLAPPEIQVGNTETRRDLTDVRDVVDAYVRLMAGGRAGTPYNVCSGRAWRVGDLLDELLHRSTVNVRVHVDPSRLRPHDSAVFQGDATRIRTELGWMPAIRVEQTLGDTLAWWRKEIQA
jgi:GDP-4-dehydro-6-deoxy-D-mannose reductase